MTPPSNPPANPGRQGKNLIKEAPRILLIEDDDEVRDMVRTVLRTRDYLVCEAANGQIGFEMIDEVHPDMIILDLRLPGMSGLEVIKQLRARAEYAKIPVLVFSGIGEKDEHPEEFWREGLQVDEFMNKATFRPEDLLGRVAYLLKRDSYRSLKPRSGDEAVETAAPVKQDRPKLSDASPEEVVRLFIESYNDRQFDVEFACLGGKLVPPTGADDFIERRLSRYNEERPDQVAQYVKQVLNSQQDAKTASVKILRENHQRGRVSTRTEIYFLENTPQGWKIIDIKVPHQK